jgi:peptidyl-tRNA hydrolase, PTH1 family
MKVICGLGNPGNHYKYTRHNIGFLALDYIADKEDFEFEQDKNFNSLIFKKKYLSLDILFIKPKTYMNLSGDSILSLFSFYKLKPEDLIVIHDDVDIPFGLVRVKVGGGTAGHNGLKSIVSKIGNNFLRIRLGIDRPPPLFDTADYVLQKFTAEEVSKLPDILEKGRGALNTILTSGANAAMSDFN